MNILAIETSCDETAVSILNAGGNAEKTTYKILGDALYSQAKLHSEFGGVYPTLAKREHQKNLVPLTIESLKQASLFEQSSEEIMIYHNFFEGIRDVQFKEDIEAFLKTTKKPNVDYIAVTEGPGLEPALWAGVSFATVLGRAWNIPVVGINHMEGHIMSALVQKENDTLVLNKPALPLLSLLISGGHTELLLMKDWFQYELVGRTRDDAVGEAFDKVARLLNLPYPGGPEIDKHASKARESDSKHDIQLPRPMITDASCDFSFSGLKTAVLYLVRDMDTLTENDRQNIAMEFEDAVRDVLVTKTKRAIEKTNPRTFVVGGGVSANQYIRKNLEQMVDSHPDIQLLYPAKGLTGDNAIMIGIAAHMRHIHSALPKETDISATGSQSLA